MKYYMSFFLITGLTSFLAGNLFAADITLELCPLDILARQGEFVVGGIAFKGCPREKTVEIVVLSVFPAYQKQGIGTRLVKELERIASDKKYNLIRLKSVSTATGFWQKLGYTPGGLKGKIYTKKIK